MSDRGKMKRSSIGVELVRLLWSEGHRIFPISLARELGPRVGLKDSYVTEALYHLRRQGWIISLRRGLYAVSSSVPGTTPVHEFEIAMALVEPAAISHWSALHYHGLTEQTPRKVFVLTTKAAVPRPRGAKAEKSVSGYPAGGLSYQFVQVTPARFFGTESVWAGEARVNMTDPERTLLDGLSMPQYCGDFAEVLHAFDARGADLKLDKIMAYAPRLGEAVAKRLGWVLEKQGVRPARLRALQELPIEGYRKLDPTGPRQGPYNRRWMIQENLPGRLLA